MTTEYLGVKQVAERLGITSGGLLNLKLPEPDATIGRTRGWLPETIDEWNAQRPGRGVGGGRPRKNKAWPIGTFMVLITVARPCGSRRVGLSFLSRGK